jgi:hypothetical protein
MALWRQLLIAAAAFFAGLVCTLVYVQVRYIRMYGPPGEPIPYGQIAQEVGIALAVLTVAFLIANWAKSNRALQP